MNLVQDVCWVLYSFLNSQDLCRVSVVSTTFMNPVVESKLWRDWVLRRWAPTTTPPSSNHPTLTWKQVYRTLHEVKGGLKNLKVGQHVLGLANLLNKYRLPDCGRWQQIEHVTSDKEGLWGDLPCDFDNDDWWFSIAPHRSYHMCLNRGMVDEFDYRFNMLIVRADYMTVISAVMDCTSGYGTTPPHVARRFTETNMLVQGAACIFVQIFAKEVNEVS